MAKGEELTEKQRQFVSEKLSGATDYQAALNAGYAETTAKVACRDIKSKPAVQAEFKRLLDKVIPDALLVGKLRAGLNATKMQRAMWDGSFTDERRDPDYATQHKFLDLACKMKQVIPENEEERITALEVNIRVIGA